MNVLLKKIWLLAQPFCIMLMMFFFLFVPCLYGVGRFSMHLFGYGMDWWAVGIFMVVMTFGALFVCIAVAGKILYFFDSLFEWDKKYEILKKPLQKE